MRITAIRIQNFGPIEEANYIFQDGVTALVGQNLTDEGQGSNGAGKSTIQQATYFGLTGDNLRGVLDKKLIRKGQEKARIQLEVLCNKRSENLTIVRELSFKSSTKLFLELNGQSVDFATYKDGNDYIQKWLQISKEDLKSYYFVCKEYYKSFFRASNTEKLALISRFINFAFLDKAKDIIGKKLSSLNEEKQRITGSIAKTEGSIVAYEDQLLQEEKKDLEKMKEEKRSIYRNKIRIFEEGIQENLGKVANQKIAKKDKQQELELLNKQFKVLQSEYKTLETTKEFDNQYNEICNEIDLLNIDKKGLEKDLSSLQSAKTRLEGALRKIAINLNGVIECPKCRHRFLTLEGTTLEEETKKKNETEKSIKEKEKEIVSFEASIKEYDEGLKELRELREEVNKQIKVVMNSRREKEEELETQKRSILSCERNIQNIDRTIESIESKSSLMKEQIENLKQAIENIDKEFTPIDTQKIEKKLEELQEVYDEEGKNLKNVDEKIFKQNEWIGRFKSFKMYLASEQIKNIQNYTNEILEKENSDLRLVIEAFKTNSKGEIKEEITSYVLRDDLESFWYYSGGERARVEIALILAIQQMINMTNPYGGLEFLSIDEVTEGLSEEGLYDIIEALDFVKYPVLITTHILNQNAKCRLLKIVKENGISRIKND